MVMGKQWDFMFSDSLWRASVGNSWGLRLETGKKRPALKPLQGSWVSPASASKGNIGGQQPRQERWLGKSILKSLMSPHEFLLIVTDRWWCYFYFGCFILQRCQTKYTVVHYSVVCCVWSSLYLHFSV